MKLLYATILSMCVITGANAQVIQDNFLGDNVNVTQINRPVVRTVTKKTRVVGKKVVNNYTTVIENNTVVQQPAPAPAPVVTPPPVQQTVVNVQQPVYVPRNPYGYNYIPQPMPMPVPPPAYPYYPY